MKLTALLFNMFWIFQVVPRRFIRSSQLEQFDKDTKAKEKGRISVKFQDKDTNFSQNSEQPCQVHQN